MKSLSERLNTALFEAGFAICHPFHPKLYNDCIQSENLGLSPLPESGMAYLIGNTKSFWPIFLKWLQEQRDADKTVQNPVDSYSQETVLEILNQTLMATRNATNQDLPAGEPYQIFWSSEYQQDRLVSMQRAASCSGLAYLDEITHLTIHPLYGTWHSFRAVIVLNSSQIQGHDLEELPPVAQIQPCLITPEEQQAGKLAMEHALKNIDQDRLCDQLHKGLMTSDEMAQAWIQLRDCIVSRGQEYRFDKNQLWYHYTKDPKYLTAALLELAP